MRLPDIVFITCHDLGRHLGAYGVPTVRTPATDALASRSVRFSNSFCTSPGCSPSRAALATGRYPHSNGVLGLAHMPFGWELGADERHAASILRDAGYHTVLFGFQHVTCRDPDAAAEYLGFAEVHKENQAPEVADQVRGVLQRSAASDRPLYLEVNLFEPHRPYDWGGAEPDDELGVTVPGYLPDRAGVRDDFAALQGAIRVMDAAVGEILAVVDSSGAADDTLVIFTTDHGLAMPRAKGTLFDAGIEVALMMRWPAAGIGGGRVVSDLVSNIDVLPTLLDLIDVNGPAAIQGRSFVHVARGRAGSARKELFAEKTFHETYDPLRCVRTDRHKLIARFDTSAFGGLPTDLVASPTFVAAFEEIVPDFRFRFGPFELYDLHDDRFEMSNLSGQRESADVEAELKQKLWAWMIDTDDPLRHGPIASPAHNRTIAGLSRNAAPG